MIPKECKRLAEVDFPSAGAPKHAPGENSIRQGHPSTLRLWWARRPMAACRAMLMPLRLPDAAENAYQAQLLTFVRLTTIHATTRQVVLGVPCLAFGRARQERQDGSSTRPFFPINYMVDYFHGSAPHSTCRKASGGVIFLRRTAR
jgi:adenine-specific DNA methylase